MKRFFAPGHKLAFAILIVCFVVPVIQGCASQFAKPSMAVEAWGPPPDNYETIVKRHFDSFLLDGESARFKFQTPVRGYANQGLVHGGGVRWTGYWVRVDVNAKNSFGGYVGWRPYIVLLATTGVYQIVEGESHPLIRRAE